MKYVVSVSGGLSSFMALSRTIEKHGRDNVEAWFADTQMECPDLYRFLEDIENVIGIEIQRLSEGRTPWQVIFDARAIMMIVNSQQFAPCSKFLKYQFLKQRMELLYTPNEATMVVGLHWDEMHRVDASCSYWKPYSTEFPMVEPPWMDNCHVVDELKNLGIDAPIGYRQGFSHNNCLAMGCVKGGHASWALLYRERPESYMYSEKQEQKFRDHVDANVAILKDRRGGEVKPMTLREFRARLDAGEYYDPYDWGGCGCFAPIQQMRMDDLLLKAY